MWNYVVIDSLKYEPSCFGIILVALSQLLGISWCSWWVLNKIIHTLLLNPQKNYLLP